MKSEAKPIKLTREQFAQATDAAINALLTHTRPYRTGEKEIGFAVGPISDVAHATVGNQTLPVWFVIIDYSIPLPPSGEEKPYFGLIAYTLLEGRDGTKGQDDYYTGKVAFRATFTLPTYQEGE